MTIFRPKLIAGAITFTCLFFAFFVANLLFSSKAAALIQPDNGVIGHQSPMAASGDVYPSGPSISPWLAVGQGDYNGAYSYAKAYSHSNTITVTINLAPCSTNVGSPIVQFTAYALKSDGQTTGSLLYTKNTSPSNCGKTFSKTVTEDSSNSSKVAGEEGWYEFMLQATMITTCPPNKSSCDTEQSFNFDVGNGNFVGLSAPVPGIGCNIVAQGGINKCDPNDPNSYTGVYARDLGSGNWNFAVQFAPQCDQAVSPKDTQVIFYDMDKGVYPQPNLEADLRRDGRTDSNFNWDTYKQFTSFTSGSNKFDYLSFSAHVTKRYQLWIQDVYWANTVQIYLPYDEFDARQDVGQTCTGVACSIVSPPVDPDPVKNGSSVSIEVDGIDSYPWPSSYYLKRLAPSYGWSTSSGVSSGTNTVNPPDNSSTTYKYAVFDSSTSNSSGNDLQVSSTCNITIVTTAPIVYADPYFKTFGADVMAGGWFNIAGSCNTSQPPYQKSTSSPTGGILGFESYGNGGASSQYGAFSLGRVDNDGNTHGFYSGGRSSASTSINNRLTFANTANPPGNFEGTNTFSNCIPDYYTTKQNNPHWITTLGGNLNNSDGQYIWKPGGSNPAPGDIFVISASTIAAGRNVSIFVNGNVYIGGNIIYAGHNVTDVPKLAIVARGNIYIGPNVTELDGWYIAQPATTNVTANDGDVWTCHDSDNTDPLSTGWVISNCGKKLVINGAVTAKQVNFMRIQGDASKASGSEESLSGANASNNIAEIINFTPEMVVGGPFFGTGTPTYTVQNLTSLPPLF